MIPSGLFSSSHRIIRHRGSGWGHGTPSGFHTDQLIKQLRISTSEIRLYIFRIFHMVECQMNLLVSVKLLFSRTNALVVM